MKLSGFLKHIILFFYPPKKGEVYFGNPADFGLNGTLEKIFHGLKDSKGTVYYKPVFSDNSYKLEIISDSMPYYICRASILAVCEEKLDWNKRSNDRRIFKSRFKALIADGLLNRESP